MCTAISFKTENHYFGRNLDLEYSYEESVTVTPRNYPFLFRKAGELRNHYAMIGMAYVVDDYPLYYDATNEKGLSMAGLSFEENAHYFPENQEKENVTPFELIPYLLGQCADVDEVEEMLSTVNIVNEAFNKELPLSPLHWLIADEKRSIVVESLASGLKVYQNVTGVLTNNPPFLQQMFQLNQYMALSKELPTNHFAPNIPLAVYSRGMGALGLPGDLSSTSRFVRAVFAKENSVCGTGDSESISQFFHILGAVEQQRGLVHMGDNKYEITVYSSCCNTKKGVYYYKTYDNSQITGVDMYKTNLDGQSLVRYPLVSSQQIRWQNV
ncbi:MAG: choloylglycine hydrolase [Lachnospiraceae bacterium]|nr:choloylglycine hydrolase [Lachnospiraceae bacterium]